MPTKSQSGRSRRRRERSPAAAPNAEPSSSLLNVNEVAAAALLVGFVLLLVGIALLASDGPGDGGAATGDAGATSADTATDTGAPAVVSPPATGDEEAIRSLARRSIEVLPAGQWLSLYDLFTGEFQQRCSREEFNQAGEDSAVQLGEDLQRLRFVRLEGLTIEGSSAQGVIVGEIVGQSEYQVQATYLKENGDWKMAPAPNTEGCQAFGRLSG